jgi:hypothetical protein
MHQLLSSKPLELQVKVPVMFGPSMNGQITRQLLNYYLKYQVICQNGKYSRTQEINASS